MAATVVVVEVEAVVEEVAVAVEVVVVEEEDDVLEVLISASRMTVTESIPLFNTLLPTAASPVAHSGSCRGAVGLGLP